MLLTSHLSFRRRRLLGPSVAQDILHLSNSLYSEGGGRAQVLVNEMGPAISNDDMTEGVYLVSSAFQPTLRVER